MSVVVGTALGCFYFVDPNNMASPVLHPAGLQVVGALLLTANAAYVAWMLWLILSMGLPHARQIAHKTLTVTRSGSVQFRRLLSSSFGQQNYSLLPWASWRFSRSSSRLKSGQAARASNIGRGVSMQVLLADDGTRSSQP